MLNLNHLLSSPPPTHTHKHTHMRTHGGLFAQSRIGCMHPLCGRQGSPQGFSLRHIEKEKRCKGYDCQKYCAHSGKLFCLASAQGFPQSGAASLRQHNRDYVSLNGNCFFCWHFDCGNIAC
ncbi:hypothetical protein DUNSADRAFT_12538 [Dunaliella salina]|uniref:Encoded protein n=1 Tax=Dunaliella salina TaxID=3046 RepID=A0ABQ7GB35_DUNSA|nr:hypothetical protein DUNSADRAFT_12538 [Dunaliella salina]|eukprot:KAF5831826.1 hypothetical protein DUNSADRAFT_12538 [Dunaliella salina]